MRSKGRWATRLPPDAQRTYLAGSTMCAAPSSNRLAAVVWDYDGTLIDTRRKNLSVNRRIVAAVSGRPAHDFPALLSLEAYDRAVYGTSNWRSFYRDVFGFTEEQTDRAAGLWSAYQRDDTTPASAFDGIDRVLDTLDAVPHGIVSQNGRSTIADALRGLGLLHHFELIVGYGEVAAGRQKPAPDGLLHCIARLTAPRPGIVVYVGDHETDVRCAREANDRLAADGAGHEVVAVAAVFADHPGVDGWAAQPDYRARAPADILEIVDRLNGP